MWNERFLTEHHKPQTEMKIITHWKVKWVVSSFVLHNPAMTAEEHNILYFKKWKLE